MIYKISFDDNVNLVNILDKLSEIGDYCIHNKDFYVSTDLSMIDIMNTLNSIKGISTIDMDNYKLMDNSFTKQWCFNQLSNQLIKEFENSEKGQSILQNLSNLIDTLSKNTQKGEIVDGTDKKDNEKINE